MEVAYSILASLKNGHTNFRLLLSSYMLPLFKMAAYSTLHAATILISDADMAILNDVIFDRQISIAYKLTFVYRQGCTDVTPAQDGGLHASGSVPINLRKATHLMVPRDHHR